MCLESVLIRTLEDKNRNLAQNSLSKNWNILAHAVRNHQLQAWPYPGA